MTRLEYDLLRDERPDLQFPPYIQLGPLLRSRVTQLSRRQAIARRTARILTRDIPAIMDPGENWYLTGTI